MSSCISVLGVLFVACAMQFAFAGVVRADVYSFAPGTLEIGELGNATELQREIVFSRNDASTKEEYLVHLRDDSGAISVVGDERFTLVEGERNHQIVLKFNTTNCVQGSYTASIDVTRVDPSSSEQTGNAVLGGISAKAVFIITDRDIRSFLSEGVAHDAVSVECSKCALVVQEDDELELRLKNTTSFDIRDVAYEIVIRSEGRSARRTFVSIDHILAVNDEWSTTLNFTSRAEEEIEVVVTPMNLFDKKTLSDRSQTFPIQLSKKGAERDWFSLPVVGLTLFIVIILVFIIFIARRRG